MVVWSLCDKITDFLVIRRCQRRFLVLAISALKWGNLAMTWLGKFVHIFCNFIVLQLNHFGLRVDREGWGFDHSVSWLWVCLSAEGAKNVCWPRLSPIKGWGSLTVTFICIFAYITHHLILLQLNTFGLRVDREWWWFEPSLSYLRVCLSPEGAENFS